MTDPEPAPTTIASVTVMWSSSLHPENGDPLYAATLSTVLSGNAFGDAYPDACTMPYVCNPPRRLGVADAGAPDVQIVACPVDLDGPAKKQPDSPDQDAWIERQVELAAAFDPEPIMWATRSGMRLYWLLEPGTVTPADYNARCAAFLERLAEHGFTGIDPTSAQWTRLQRVPRGEPALLPPGGVQFLKLPPAPAGAAAVAPTVRGALSECLLFAAWEAAGFEVGPISEDKAAVRCPWDHEHSDSGAPGYDPLSGRAVIMAGAPGTIGIYRCQHAHCTNRGTREVLSVLLGIPAARAMIDARDAHKRAAAEALLEATEPVPAPTSPANSPNAAQTGHDPAVDEVIVRLSSPHVGVYQRSGHLCTVTRDAHVDGDMVRPAGAPTIRELAPARLREIIRMTCGERLVGLAGEVMARNEWAFIRPLDAIVTYPVLRRDGTLLLTNGYDAQTRTLAEIDVQVDVPEHPTQAEARAALAMLTELVCDFPFVSDAQRSAWLAILLTVPARPAIEGPTPLGLLEASQRGSGKTLLADVIAVVATGREAPRRVAPKTKEEWDKAMLATLLAGDPVVLIDNVTNMLVSDALDAVLTGTTFTQRLLGVSEERRVAVRTVFLASSNNARLSSDLVRRSIACRLEPEVERPEARTGFRYPDLIGHVRRNRAALLGAALTVLRAYAVAGRPKVDARPMGSYGAWCRVVRDALVWAGGTDPAATQDALRESADVERDELQELLLAWETVLPDKAVTVRALGGVPNSPARSARKRAARVRGSCARSSRSGLPLPGSA